MAKTQPTETTEILEVTETYFQKRMSDLAVNPDTYKFGKYRYFHENKTNIEIKFPSINGDLANTKTRLNPANEKEYTYFQETKGNFLFFLPNVLKAYADKTQIETLYLTIGEFKATSGNVNGLNIIGISNKYGFLQSEALHPDLVSIIEECEVQNIVFMLDADIFNLTWNPETEPDKDLAANLFQHFNAITKFRLLAKEKVKSVYLSVIRERLQDQNVKGLDDLFDYKRGTEIQVLEDLERLTMAKSYFSTINLSIESLSKIKSFLHINFLKGVPQDFYNKYNRQIGEKEFTFLRGRYQWDKIGEGLTLTRHADSEMYMRVGCDFLRIIHVPNSKGILNRKLEGWKAGEIQRDYVVGLGIKNFFNTIPKHLSFCNVPENSPEKYQQVIEDCYNLYYPLDHKLATGAFPQTDAFLKHIFGDRKLVSGYSNYDLAMDWLTLLYQNPTQKLPAICLVSKEKNTGKSTFIFWLNDIYKENATRVGNNDFNDAFNDDYISKLLIGVDESFIEKKLIMETIKSRITDDTAKIRGLYSGRREIPFVAKFVMTSNNETNFIQIDDDENRFWINRVEPFTGEENPLLRQDMIKEIPFFLNFLKTRKVLHPFKNRLYFQPDLLLTEAARKVKNESKSTIVKEITEMFKEKFHDLRYHTLYYSISEATAIVNGGKDKTKFNPAYLKSVLESNFKMSNEKHIRASHPTAIPNPDTEDNALADTLEPKKGRLFTFKLEDFYTPDQIDKNFPYCNYDDIRNYRVQRGQTESVEGLGI